MVSHSQASGQDGEADFVYKKRSGRCRRFVCFACREREEMKGELGILQQYASWSRR